jgi:hypothetical protein
MVVLTDHCFSQISYGSDEITNNILGITVYMIEEN